MSAGVSEATGSGVAAVDVLVEVAAIERVEHRYLRLLDTKAFDEIGGCFTADATAAFSDGRHQLASRDEIVAFLRRLLGSPQVLTNHQRLTVNRFAPSLG